MHGSREDEQNNKHRLEKSLEGKPLGPEKVGESLYFFVNDKVHVDDVVDGFACFIDNEAGALGVGEVFNALGGDHLDELNLG